MPSSLASRLDQDEDLALAIALSKSLQVLPDQEDDSTESNPGGQPDKPPGYMMEEEEQEERRIAEQLHTFLSDAQRILQTADATADELHALIPCAAARAPDAAAPRAPARHACSLTTVCLRARALLSGRCPNSLLPAALVP